VAGAKLREARVLVNVVGSRTEEFATVVSMLDDSPAVSGYELNVSCPNVRAGGMEFGADSASLTDVVTESAAGDEETCPSSSSQPTLQDIAEARRPQPTPDPDDLLGSVSGSVHRVRPRQRRSGLYDNVVAWKSRLYHVGVLHLQDFEVRKLRDGVGGVQLTDHCAV